MGFFSDSLHSAFGLVIGLDPELLTIVGVSLQVSFFSTLIASLLGVPFGFWIAISEFYGRRAVITVLNTLLSLPTVAIALFVYILISRRGVFGDLGWLYTLKAIVLGQTILIFPIVASFTLSAISGIDSRYRKTALTLGATRTMAAAVVLYEARFGILAALIASFGRVISEVGISMMLGGNIKGFTRTITTAMALEYDKGEFVLALALGMVLIILSFFLNIVFNAFQGRMRL